MFNLDILIKGFKSLFSSTHSDPTPEPGPDLDQELYPEIPYGFFETHPEIPMKERERIKYAPSSYRRVLGVVAKHAEVRRKEAEARFKQAAGASTNNDDFDFDIDELE